MYYLPHLNLLTYCLLLFVPNLCHYLRNLIFPCFCFFLQLNLLLEICFHEMNFCQNLFCLSQILCHFVQFLYNYLKNLISLSFCLFQQLILLHEFPFHLHFFQAQNSNNHIAKRSTSFQIRSAAKKNMDHKSQPQGIHSTKWITNMDHGFLKRSAPY